MTTPVLRMEAVSKRFPGTLALDHVSLVVERGSIHGLIGENGAGKSTLLKILAGDQRPSSGTIALDGEVVDIATPRDAHRLGIGIVYQELSLLPNLSVADNISLGSERRRGLSIDQAALDVLAQTTLDRMGVTTVEPARRVADLPLAERQLVEIAKVLTLRSPRILIFDEPTAALPHHDVERLFRIFESLRSEGVAIIFVSHRYREVLQVCDRLTVLRNGRVVGDVQRGEASLERLVELTLGRRAEAAFQREWRSLPEAEPLLETRDLRVGQRVTGIDLTLRSGEIVGLCGLLGSGQNEVARALCGDEPDVAGSVRLHGHEGVPTSPRRALANGAGLITENRQDEGLFPEMIVRFNMSIAALPRMLWSRLIRVIRRGRERSLTEDAARRTGVAPMALTRRIRVLSGGNQQKAILGRWLLRRCDILVCIEPTRGVDVGAKLEIYRQLESLARAGAGVVVVSTELPEIMSLVDRIVVLYRGRQVAMLDPRTAREHDVLVAMQGGLERAA
jgi:ABC-type sugar transport system ATPase subunit